MLCTHNVLAMINEDNSIAKTRNFKIPRMLHGGYNKN